MKLLNRTSYMLITIMLVVFFFGSIGFYYFLKSSSDKEIRNELSARMEFMLMEIYNNPLNYKNLAIPGYISVTEIERIRDLHASIGDTLLVDHSDFVYKQYKYMSREIATESGNYRVTMYKSLIESNELIEEITLIVTMIIILFILFIYLLNRFMFERIWSDFFKTLKKLKSFDVNDEKPIQFNPSEIQEFDLLNAALNQMIAKIHKDYENMKEFSGNISHEIQTPLTIIRQKSELLLQTEPLNKKQLELIRDIQNTNSRLARLNKVLVLLTKIENKQFVNKEEILVHEVIESHLESFRSIANAKNITINFEHIEACIVKAEPILIDTLIVNLIKNSVSHNIPDGEVSIHLGKKELIISNSGEDHDLSGENIFERYAKTKRESESLGLGLAIVRKVCNLYGYQIEYHFQDKKHIFTLRFEKEFTGNFPA